MAVIETKHSLGDGVFDKTTGKNVKVEGFSLLRYRSDSTSFLSIDTYIVTDYSTGKANTYYRSADELEKIEW